jgi:hypothetical protein
VQSIFGGECLPNNGFPAFDRAVGNTVLKNAIPSFDVFRIKFTGLLIVLELLFARRQSSHLKEDIAEFILVNLLSGCFVILKNFRRLI